MKAIPLQPREASVDAPGPVGFATRFGLTTVLVLALARWRSWRRN